MKRRRSAWVLARWVYLGLTAFTANPTVSDEALWPASVATFRDGKIVKEQNLGDTAMLERVYGTK